MADETEPRFDPFVVLTTAYAVLLGTLDISVREANGRTAMLPT